MTKDKAIRVPSRDSETKELVRDLAIQTSNGIIVPEVAVLMHDTGDGVYWENAHRYSNPSASDYRHLADERGSETFTVFYNGKAVCGRVGPS